MFEEGSSYRNRTMNLEDIRQRESQSTRWNVLMTILVHFFELTKEKMLWDLREDLKKLYVSKRYKEKKKEQTEQNIYCLWTVQIYYFCN